MRRNIAPSPSTRASRSVLIVRVSLMRFTRGAERLGVGVERPVDAYEVHLLHPETGEPRAERLGAWRLHRAEAPVAPAVVGGAQRAAARMGDRPEARRAVGHHHADVAAALALDAHAVRGDGGPAVVQERADDLEQLVLVDR